jgi:hypothetical protein
MLKPNHRILLDNPIACKASRKNGFTRKMNLTNQGIITEGGRLSTVDLLIRVARFVRK